MGQGLQARAVAALVAAIGVGLAAVAVAAPLGWLVKLVPDDGFYYLEIARRIGQGQGSTFDGLHATNGYHPLWLALLVPLAPVMAVSRLAGLRIALLAGIAMLGATVGLVGRWGARSAPHDAPLGALWVGCTLGVASVYGMESPLAALLAASTWTVAARGLPGAAAGGAALGALSSALVLARLDAAVFVAALDAVWLAEVARRRAPWYGLAAAVGVQVAFAVAFVGVNHAWFGLWVPISASLKASRQGGPNLVWARSLLALCGLASAGIAALSVVEHRRDPAPDGVRVARLAAALGTLGAMALLAAGGGRETYNWYFTLPVLGGGWLLPGVLAGAVARGAPRRLVHAGVWAGCLALLAIAVRGKAQPTGFAEKITRAVWLSRHAPPDAVFAEGDCGILGYVSTRPFVNLDGLTNGPAYLDAIDDGTVDAWLLDAGVNAIALPTGDPPDARLIPRGRHHGQKVPLDARLSPWTPPIADEAYTLWRIEALAPATADGAAPPAR